MTVALTQLARTSAQPASTARAWIAARGRQDGFLRRLFGRRAPSLYQRCLAVHIASAARSSALR